MIAIAGSNGGCGKTTTTLGLARAVARTDAPVLAVDADRQLPDLHVTAGVDRTPTIAAVDSTDDPVALAQSVPDLPGVSVLPGPKPDESVDVTRALAALEGSDCQVFVDCPSGVGPDLTDPLTASDRVVVVAAGDSQRVADVRTTVDIARRLEVPVAGVVVTGAEAVSEALASALDVSVLAAVPRSGAPLSDEAALAAYEEAAAALLSDPADTTESPPPAEPASASIPTGVAPLDGLLDGGYPAGSVVALVAEAASHAERILYRLPASRGTLYVSTDRPAPLVRDALAATPAVTDHPTIRTVGPADPVGETAALLADLPEGAGLVVDAVDALEAADGDDYPGFLQRLRARMAETGGVALLHCPDRGPATRTRALTERVADVVLTVETVAADRRVEQRVAVRKCRADPDATGVTSLSVDRSVARRRE